MSIKLSHQRIGRINLRPLFEEDYPISSLRLHAAHRAEAFQGNIWMYEYGSLDGPLFEFIYELQHDVPLRKEDDREGLKLLWMIDGCISLQLTDTEKWKITQGQLCLFRSSDYMVGLTGNCKIRYLLFPVDKLLEQRGWTGFEPGRFDLSPRIQVHLSDILQPPDELDKPEDWLSLQLAQLLYQLKYTNGGLKVVNDYRLAYVQAAIQYIRQNLTRDITTKEIAKNVGFNECDLKKAFSEHIGMGMGEWQNVQRIILATQLMLHKEKSTKEIRLECGFKNRNTFCNNFQNVNKMTPAEWRKIHKV